MTSEKPCTDCLLGPRSLACDNDNRHLYVCGGERPSWIKIFTFDGDFVTRFNLQSCLGPIPMCCGPGSVCVNADHQIYVYNCTRFCIDVYGFAIKG